jgi:hypothetical protein
MVLLTKTLWEVKLCLLALCAYRFLLCADDDESSSLSCDNEKKKPHIRGSPFSFSPTFSLETCTLWNSKVDRLFLLLGTADERVLYRHCLERFESSTILCSWHSIDFLVFFFPPSLGALHTQAARQNVIQIYTIRLKKAQLLKKET